MADETDPLRPVEIGADAIVVRFAPARPEGVLSSAERAHAYDGRYRVSVYADRAREGESRQQVQQRLLVAAELGGIKSSGNRYYWVCAEARDLYNRGFRFFKDGFPGEVAEHYSVDFEGLPTLADVERFLEPFAREKWT